MLAATVAERCTRAHATVAKTMHTFPTL